MSIQNNTTSLNNLLAKVNALPEAENLDSELSTQDSLISQIATTLEGKTAGSGSGGVEYEEITATNYTSTLYHSMSRYTHVRGAGASYTGLASNYYEIFALKDAKVYAHKGTEISSTNDGLTFSSTNISCKSTNYRFGNSLSVVIVNDPASTAIYE